MTEPRDAPYPELKKSHTMARTGRPWPDHKPPPAAPVWAAIQGLGSYHVARAAIELDVFDTLAESGPSSVGVLAARLEVSEPHLGSLLDSLVALDLIEWDQSGIPHLEAVQFAIVDHVVNRLAAAVPAVGKLRR